MARTDRATFRLPAWALFLPVMLLFLITPLATANAWWGVTFLVPLVGLIWVGITRTTANATRVKTYGLLGTRRMNWSDLDRLEVQDARWVVAVGNDGRRLRLAMVRPHDLRRLIAVSGGSLRVDDEAAATEERIDPDPMQAPTPGMSRTDPALLEPALPEPVLPEPALVEPALPEPVLPEPVLPGPTVPRVDATDTGTVDTDSLDTVSAGEGGHIGQQRR